MIAVERDPLLADIARYNFARIGLRNIQVINASAEEFVATPGLEADLIYADPDRRSAANKKLVLLGDCTPDIVQLHSRLHEIAPRVVVKVSPLFDPAEAFRIFGPHTRVEAVSLRDECKELLVETGSHIEKPTVAASAIDSGEVEWLIDSSSSTPTSSFSTTYRYLLLPDVALRKMRMARRYFAARGCFIASESGYAFCDELPEAGLFRAFEIEAILPYKPKEIRRLGLKNLTIMQRDFPLSNARIATQLGVREGGGRLAAFTMIENAAWMALLVGRDLC